MRAVRFASAALATMLLLLCRVATEAIADTAATQTCPYRPTHSMPLAMSWPDYPLLSVALNEQGSVILDFLVKPDGSIDDVKVYRSSGFARLDGAAVDAARQRWRFDPVMLDGKPIACRAKVGVVWKLEQSPEELVRAGFALVRLTAADFPPGSLQRGEKGVTAIMLLVSERGTVEQGHVVQSSGFPDLDTAAIEIAKQGRWHFEPAQVERKSVKSMVGLVVVWSQPGG